MRKMETQFDTAHSTTMVTFEDVKVHKSNLIGPENGGFMLILLNFNHERFVISAGMPSPHLCERMLDSCTCTCPIHTHTHILFLC